LYLFLNLASSLSSFSAIVDDSSTLFSSSVLDRSSSLQSRNVCSANLLYSVEKYDNNLFLHQHSLLLTLYKLSQLHQFNTRFKSTGWIAFLLFGLFVWGGSLTEIAVKSEKESYM